MALKIEQAFGYEEGFLLLLQTYYEIAEYKNGQKSRAISGTPAIRRSLFWDTDFDTLDWERYRESVIARVLERGNDAEKRRLPDSTAPHSLSSKPILRKHIPYKHDIAKWPTIATCTMKR